MYNVAKAMYFLRFFLRGHEGTHQFVFNYEQTHEWARYDMRKYNISREALVDNKELKQEHMPKIQRRLESPDTKKTKKVNHAVDDVVRAYLVTEPAGA